jgi:hypothetical protein
MSYKLIHNSTNILRLSDGAIIPADFENGDYKTYLFWCSENNTPEPADIGTSDVSQSVSPVQARRAIIQAGLKQQVDDYIAAASDEVKLWWEYATVIERNHPEIENARIALGMSSEDLDMLFVLAGSMA